MITSPEITGIENEVAIIRKYLADQIKNNFTPDDPLARLIEERSDEALLVVLLERNNSNISARNLEGEERDQIVVDICSEQNTKLLIQSSARFDGNDQWPAGMRSLYKKINHALVAKGKGSISTSYDDFNTLRFANNNVENVQGAAEALIWEIMNNPATVILRGRTTDIINTLGQGVRFYSHPTGSESRPVYPFVGFTDAMLYCNPLTIQQKERLQQSSARRNL